MGTRQQLLEYAICDGEGMNTPTLLLFRVLNCPEPRYSSLVSSCASTLSSTHSQSFPFDSFLLLPVSSSALSSAGPPPSHLPRKPTSYGLYSSLLP